ncbi:MAG: hypothetical protein Q8R59_09840, partial [Polaromonas sp.]|nr:hypothetical protein [Polaromonas sp.]
MRSLYQTPTQVPFQTPYNFFVSPTSPGFYSMRRLVATVLLFFVFCQTLAVGAQGMTLGHAETEENQHALLHWEGVAHHHSENGSTHLDNSDESVQHMLTDMVLGAGAVLLPAPLASFLP